MQQDSAANFNELQVMGMIGFSVMTQKPKKGAANTKVKVQE